MDDKGGVEGLRNKLYSRNNKDGIPPRTELSHGDAEVRPVWEDSRPNLPERPVDPAPAAPRRSHKSLAFKFLMGSAAFFVLAALAAAYFFFGGSNYISARNIDLEIVAPSLVDGGSQTQIQFIVTNRNSSELLLADLVIDYPDGTRDPKDPTKPLMHERQSIGTLAPGQQVKRTAEGVFYGEEGAAQTVHAALEYSVPNSNAVFVKEISTSITMGSSPVSVAVSAPDEAIAGQPFDLEVKVQSNAQTPVEDVVVEAQYPFGFSVISASPERASNSLWRLGAMAPGASQTIKIRGAIEGSDGDERVFRFLAGSQADQSDPHIKVPFLSIPATVTLHRPFIAGTLSINGESGKSVSAPQGSLVQGKINWQNNLSDSISAVEVKLTLSGPLLDKSTVNSSNGFYQSADNTITWTADQDPSLAKVAPGGTGVLQFSFMTEQPGTGGVVYANPVVDLALSVKGVREPSQGGGVPTQVVSAATTQVTLSSATSLAAQASYLSGPRPPKADQKTWYTITWTVKNSSNAIAGTNVSTVLPPYMDFVSSGDTSVTYDAASRTVRWALDDLKAGVGYSAPARNASFQVVLNASQSQVSQAPALTGTAQLTGQDRFAQVPVTATAAAPTTVDIVGAAQ